MCRMPVVNKVRLFSFFKFGAIYVFSQQLQEFHEKLLVGTISNQMHVWYSEAISYCHEHSEITFPMSRYGYPETLVIGHPRHGLGVPQMEGCFIDVNDGLILILYGLHDISGKGFSLII